MEEGGEATGDQHVTGTPDTLVEGQAVRQQPTANDEHRANEEEGDDLIADSRLLTDKPSAIEAQEHMSDGGDGAQQTLGIDRAFVIKMVGVSISRIPPSNVE